MGLLRMAGRTAVIAGTATAVSGRVARRQSNKWEAQDEAQYAQQQAAAQQAAPPPAAGGDDMFEQLEKLGKLKEQGILTEAEFEAQKAKLLAG
jgi:Short C-terminal domain